MHLLHEYSDAIDDMKRLYETCRNHVNGKFTVIVTQHHERQDHEEKQVVFNHELQRMRRKRHAAERNRQPGMHP